MRAALFGGLLGLCCWGFVGCQRAGSVSTPIKAARLAQESSPYLRQHADNVVDWFPWGDEAFAKAKAENKPIFLSVGYSTCHWCHVMEEESFMNPEVGKFLNENFVPIKVDRETRPDIDRLYMQFLVSSTGSGGWPMSVFLTPEAQPFLAGTYYPQPEKYGRIGFLDLLGKVSDEWTRDAAGITQEASQISGRMAGLGQVSPSKDLPDTTLAATAVQSWSQSYDKSHGGFGPAPKFPQATQLGFLLDYGVLHPKSPAKAMALATLQSMALGGIHDQLEGGFHRYSTDARWLVPHFEKMLSDQALLLSLYSRAYALQGRQIDRDAVESTAEYLERRLRLPDGGYASAEDADSATLEDPKKHTEGAFYVWSSAQIEQVLSSAEAALAKKLFGLEAKGNTGAQSELAGSNVLWQAQPKLKRDPMAARVLAKLRESREQRPRPSRDDKALTAWNAMLAGALVEASTALNRPEYLERAQTLLQFLETSMVVDGQLRRSYFEQKAEGSAFAHDYAELVHAYLTLYHAEGGPEALQRAVFWQSQLDQRFQDPAHGGYFETEAGHGLLFRDRELQDGAVPTTASRTAVNLVRLYQLTGQENYRESYEDLLKSVGPSLEEHPQSLPGVLNAIELMNSEESVVLVGDRPDWWRLLQKGYHPQRSLHWLRDESVVTTLGSLVPAFLAALPKSQAVYFCQSFACGLPITSTEELRVRLEK